MMTRSHMVLKFLELFEACVKYVEANEPYIHRYELHRGIKELNNGKEQFVILEGSVCS